MEYLIAHIGHTTKSCEHLTWWKPDSRGYTVCIEKAGLYTEAEARGICRSSFCIAVVKDEAAKLARSTPYYRKSNGDLARLYDGGPHAVVPNGRNEWKVLMGVAMDCGQKPDKPTPIGAKARAVYLPDERTQAQKEQRNAGNVD
ncbi:hypothetical protein [Comamonas testosteroni]|uniref:hypothetical protein n=1 Tax=Comamonas testosteroni TaxID=285 RepID=UPI00391C1158